MSPSQDALGISLELVRPWMLWCLLLLVPVAWHFYRSLSDFPRWQRRASLICRCVIVVLIVLALAGLALLSPTTRQYVVVDCVDVAGRYINEAETHLTLIRPGLDREDIELAQTAPGRYEAEFATAESGAYHLELSQQQNGKETFRQTRSVVVGYADELRLGPPDEALMRRIADVSGGRYGTRGLITYSYHPPGCNDPAPLGYWANQPYSA